ncbi:Calcium-transporting ATPase 1 [Durusdinium trenchii]|uniref:Calcium-transporting ATPase 1 n=1 Tax=Durusdinium trenchii TaxID=1381693 RepID=A0ABP0HF54_9DINO
MVLNGAVLSLVIVRGIAVYLFALVEYCDGQVLQSEIQNLVDPNDPDNKSYGTDQLSKARTVTFISLVWSENIRSYIARSFDKPFYINLCGNRMMQYAIILAQLALYAAVFIPFFSDKILELVGLDIGEKGWAMAVIGPVGTLILCELSKVITYYQMKNYQRWLAKKEAENAAKLEADIAATPRKACPPGRGAAQVSTRSRRWNGHLPCGFRRGDRCAVRIATKLAQLDQPP